MGYLVLVPQRIFILTHVLKFTVKQVFVMFVINYIHLKSYD